MGSYGSHGGLHLRGFSGAAAPYWRSLQFGEFDTDSPRRAIGRSPITGVVCERASEFPNGSMMLVMNRLWGSTDERDYWFAQNNKRG